MGLVVKARGRTRDLRGMLECRTLTGVVSTLWSEKRTTLVCAPASVEVRLLEISGKELELLTEEWISAGRRSTGW